MDGDDTVQTDGRNDVSDAASAVEQRACDAREQGLGWEEAEECGVARGGSDGAAAGGRAEAGSAVTTPRSAAFRVAELPAPRANGGACVEREDYRDGGSGATEAREASHVDGGEEDLTAGIATSTRGIAFSPLHPAPSPSPLLGSTDDLRLPAASSSPRAVAEACAWAVREDDSGLAVASSTDEMSVRMEVGAAVQERYMDMALLADMEHVLWEVERRFRELVALQHHMSALLDGPLALPYSPLMHSHALSPPLHRPPQSQPAAAPSPVAAAWQAVREEAGRFLGGASGPAVQRRCEILQATLSALLAAGPPLSTAPPLLSFLAHPIMQHSPWAALAPTPAPDAPSGAWAPPPLLQGAERGGWHRESEGFFAMRDLVDASKGRFAVLPDMLARLASSLRRHMASGCIERPPLPAASIAPPPTTRAACAARASASSAPTPSSPLPHRAPLPLLPSLRPRHHCCLPGGTTRGSWQQPRASRGSKWCGATGGRRGQWAGRSRWAQELGAGAVGQ
ncbi:hypothetical protein CLOM_g23594 [Closterium sp. NIES-68]|nr:hypothetical protein CLOM_g23594 [Closterium sp. NIES-68]